jgi:SPP1 gp7 family putative phage head morphogenesis protein
MASAISTPPHDRLFKPLPPDRVLKIFEDRLLLPRETLKEIGEGAYSLAWSVAGVTEFGVLETLRDALSDVIKEGGTLEDWLGSLEDILDSSGWGTSEARAETIFRTTLASVFEADRYDELKGDEFVEFLVFDAINDDRVRPDHLALDGKAWNRDDFPDEYWPPLDYNCFPPGVQVEGSFIAGSRMLYAGKVIDLKTAGGDQLSVTPNHPIATPGGMVAARLLHNGCKVLAHGREIEEVTPVSVPSRPPAETADDQQRPAKIEEVFRALAEVFGMVTTHVVGSDLHGDAQGGNGHVDVAAPEGKLRRGITGQAFGNGQDLGFEPPNPAMTERVGDGTSAESLLPVRRAEERPGMSRAITPTNALVIGELARSSPGSPSRSALSLETAGSGLDRLPLERFRFGLSAELDAALLELAAEGRTANSGLIGELLERFPGVVSLDEVVEVRERDFAGHVYDLQSVTGFIIAAGLIVSNCRCSVYPADGEQLPSLGAKTQGAGLVLDDNGDLIRAADGFQGPPSVRGLSSELRADLNQRLMDAGWQKGAPAEPVDKSNTKS